MLKSSKIEQVQLGQPKCDQKLYTYKNFKLLLINHCIYWISISMVFEFETTHSLHGLRHTPPKKKKKKTKGYTTKWRYQQTRRNKQKTPQIINDQLDNT
jgi:hypothetical protein